MSVGDLVLVHDETHPRSYWKMGKVERLLMSKDGQSRGAEVRVQGRGSSGGGLLMRQSKYLNHPNSQRKVEREEIDSGVELQSRESEEKDSGLLNYKMSIKFLIAEHHGQ